MTKRRLAQLLEEKEPSTVKSVGRSHDQWLTKKALAIASIQESGTFRYLPPMVKVELL